ncbi:methylated-DNA--[protein]-cysteine S-methyltransferase [Candidatus Saccharibacteria bacterium]|nr:methylated-DNA--[protein]-cysteine S-methyltransferase [Candidatus Saccharibacteria bacterium]
MADPSFKKQVYKVVAKVPKGQVVTYGQLAAMAGSPGAARVVGQIAHFGSLHLPWHRVVNAQGGLAVSYVPGGRLGQAEALKREGVVVSENFKVDIHEYQWTN